jgi:hypothetical protein
MYKLPKIIYKTHILIFSTMIFTLYRGKNTRIIKVNPFHDDTTADEKYQFTCSVVFSSWKGLYPCRSVVNCSSEMVLSIRYSTIKKKEAARIEYSAIRATSFVSIVVYPQREQRVFLHFPLFCLLMLSILNLLKMCSTI